MRRKIAVVVDDEAKICTLIEAALEDLPVSVFIANTAEEAIKISADYVIDLFFVDIYMPGKGGIWLIEQLKETHPEASIIAMSGGFEAMSADKTMEAMEKIGVTHRINKPFKVREIIDLANGICGFA